MEKLRKKLYVGLLLAALLTPIGILLPVWFNAGDAWGEWSTETIKEKLGYVPEGMQKDAEAWKAPLSDYTLGKESISPVEKSVTYILSALIGLAIISFLSFGLLKMTRKE
jgi:hypothetical protein